MGMRTFLLIFASLGGVCSFAFLMAGLGALLALDDRETDEFQQRAVPISGITAFGRIGSFFRICLRADGEIVRLLMPHWRSRPQARWLLGLGTLLLVAAVSIAWWLFVTA